LSTDQLATRAVDAISAVRAIQVDTENPLRHIPRGLKREAEGILEAAFHRAHMLAMIAQEAIQDGEKIAKATKGGEA